jgi:hypothetical protein
VTLAHAQIIKVGDYKWPATPEKIEVEKQFAGASAVVLKDVRIYDFYYDKSKSKDVLALEHLHHRIVQINDTRAIEVYNKLYIPLTGVIEVMDIQARTISPDGKITEIDKSKIKELANKDGEGAYKIFAFEGLEKGSRLEYFYKVREDVDYSLRCTVQGSDPVQFHQIEIISPENLKFEYKTYNGKSETIDTVQGEKRYILLTSRNIPGLDEEKYGTYNANLMRHELQLAYNTSVSRNRILSYSSAAQRSYAMLFDKDAKAVKKIKKVSDQLKLSKLDAREKIKHIENYIKTTYQIDKKRSAELEDLTKVLQDKLTDNTGVLKLYINFFEVNDVNCQVVYTTERNKVIFDPDFESWNYLAESILYFPDLNEYLDPSDLTIRFPMISTLYTLNNGMFLEEMSIGKIKSATYSVKKIPAPDVSKNGEIIDAACRFNKNMDSVNVKFTRSFMGQLAYPYRFIFNYIQKDDKKKALDELMKFAMPDARVVTEDVQNIDFLDSEKPLVTTGEVVGSALIEKTGKDVIFKIGDLLGPQSELYQEKERQSQIDMFYAHSYKRTIRLEIPAGYKLSGLDAIKMNIHFDYAGKDACGFASDYTLDGNALNVTVREYYNVIQLPKTEFENFRKVINAAADFNKISVVLEKI